MSNIRKTPEIDHGYTTFFGKREIGETLFLGRIPRFGLGPLGQYEAIAQRDQKKRVRVWWLDEYTLEGEVLRLPTNVREAELDEGQKDIILGRLLRVGV